MASFSKFGNDLYTGERSYNIVGRRKAWYAVSVVLIVLAAIGLFGQISASAGFRVESTSGSHRSPTRQLRSRAPDRPAAPWTRLRA